MKRRASHTLRGARISLEPFEARFVTERYVGWLRDDIVSRFISKAGTAVTLEDVRAFCSSMMDSTDDFFFAILLDGRHIGNVRLGKIDWNTRTSGFGILIGERGLHGQGLGSEAVNTITDFAFADLGLQALRFPVVEEHAAAMRLYRKCGFTQAGPWPKPFERNGRLLPMAMFEKSNSSAG